MRYKFINNMRITIWCHDLTTRNDFDISIWEKSDKCARGKIIKIFHDKESARAWVRENNPALMKNLATKFARWKHLMENVETP